MRCSVSRVGVLVVMLGLTTCLRVPEADEAEGTTSGTGSGTSDTSACADGEQGCPCFPNETCNGGLICYEGALCFPMDCIAGTQGCPCLDAGGCDVGLACSSGQCVPDGSSTTTGSTTTGGTTDTDAAGSSGPADACSHVPAAGVCTQCAKENCCADFQDCLDDQDCSTLLLCLDGTGDHVGCAARVNSKAEAYRPIADCIVETVGIEPSMEVACSVCAPPTMLCLGGEPSYLACTECAARDCCDELRQCREDPRCTCLEACFSMGGQDAPACANNCPNGEDLPYDEFRGCTEEFACGDKGQACYPLAPAG